MKHLLIVVPFLALLAGCRGEDPVVINGAQGVSGAQGLQGIQGAKGDVGPQGLQGEQGLPGANGKDGIDGLPGAQGPQGEQGPAGAPGAGPAPITMSGARLRARYIEGADGAKEFLGWFDSQLGYDCVFRSLSGVFGCFPDAKSTMTYPAPFVPTFFSDAACTQQLVLPSYPYTKFVYIEVSGAVFPIGPHFGGDVYTNDNQPCAPTDYTVTNAYPISAGSPVSDFVTGEIKTE